jgi:hypothetical protein
VHEQPVQPAPLQSLQHSHAQQEPFLHLQSAQQSPVHEQPVQPAPLQSLQHSHPQHGRLARAGAATLVVPHAPLLHDLHEPAAAAGRAGAAAPPPPPPPTPRSPLHVQSAQQSLAHLQAEPSQLWQQSHAQHARLEDMIADGCRECGGEVVAEAGAKREFEQSVWQKVFRLGSGRLVDEL